MIKHGDNIKSIIVNNDNLNVFEIMKQKNLIILNYLSVEPYV